MLIDSHYGFVVFEPVHAVASRVLGLTLERGLGSNGYRGLRCGKCFVQLSVSFQLLLPVDLVQGFLACFGYRFRRLIILIGVKEALFLGRQKLGANILVKPDFFQGNFPPRDLVSIAIKKLVHKTKLQLLLLYRVSYLSHLPII